MIDKKELAKKIAGLKIDKPKLNPNLKIRAMTDPEVAMSQWKERYQKNGKTTWGGTARLMGDVGKTMFSRAFLGRE